MRRTLAAQWRELALLSAVTGMAVAVTAYILAHQPAFTFGQSYYTVSAEFSTGAAITSGQGQAVTIAGVQVGLIGGVRLDDGRALVTMNIDKQYAPIYRNATVLLRPRTPLKDMYLALDPGTKTAGPIPNGGRLGTASTSPDIDVDQILSSLDADSRNYLLLLLADGAGAFRDSGSAGPAPSLDAVADLRGTFKRFAPLARDTRTFASRLATRNQDVARSVHNFKLVAGSLGGVDTALGSLITSADKNFSAISSQDGSLKTALTLLPGTIRQTSDTLGEVRSFAAQAGPTLHKLVPFASALAPALKSALPLFRDTTPVISRQLRPFSVAIQPLARTLAPAASDLARAVPALVHSVQVLNALFNELAYQPHGSDQGYLFWGAWLSHIAASLTDTQDAQGPIVRSVLMANCPTLQLLETTIEQGSPALGPLLKLLNLPDWSKIKSRYCPTGSLP